MKNLPNNRFYRAAGKTAQRLAAITLMTALLPLGLAGCGTHAVNSSTAPYYSGQKFIGKEFSLTKPMALKPFSIESDWYDVADPSLPTTATAGGPVVLPTGTQFVIQKFVEVTHGGTAAMLSNQPYWATLVLQARVVGGAYGGRIFDARNLFLPAASPQQRLVPVNPTEPNPAYLTAAGQ
ncbi:MAG: hypothetical protein HKL96_12435 [Phycisphaerales bacterium]|nr:hypothetical protein [Phycisphaerales bacterium]